MCVCLVALKKKWYVAFIEYHTTSCTISNRSFYSIQKGKCTWYITHLVPSVSAKMLFTRCRILPRAPGQRPGEGGGKSTVYPQSYPRDKGLATSVGKGG